MKSFKNVFLLILAISGFQSQAQDWANLEKYREANQTITSGNEKPRVVFMGNSITEGWAGQDPDFFSENNYTGRGISGQTTPQMLVRFRPDVIDLNPEAVVILAGTNDIAGNTGPMTIEETAGNIFSMAELAQAHGIRVVISSLLPVYNYPWKPEIDDVVGKIDRLNKMLKDYANQNNMTYLDYFPATADDRLGFKKKYSEDGVHPNLAGYKVMEPLVIKAIDQALAK